MKISFVEHSCDKFAPIKILDLYFQRSATRRNSSSSYTRLLSLVFLSQVDVDLFLTLTNSDLIEIGIEHEEDRCALLEAIKKYKIDLKYDNI